MGADVQESIKGCPLTVLDLAVGMIMMVMSEKFHLMKIDGCGGIGSVAGIYNSLS